jgi:hypothetical protein
MDHDERLEKYAIQVAASQAGPGNTFIAWASEENHLLTPAMRRRLRHKRHAGHTHRDLQVVTDMDGRQRRLPCPRCQPPPDLLQTGLSESQPWRSGTR